MAAPSRWACSCITTAFDLAGIRAPVKMRHALPGASDGGSAPALLSPITGSTQGGSPSRSAVDSA